MIKKAFFRFYEELNDFLPEEKRKAKFEHKFIDQASIKDMIESLGVPHTEIDMILVNGDSVDFKYIVQDKDEISVYPVFESLDISKVQHLRNKPLREPKFVADIHLGSLAKYLRMFGFDVLYKNDFANDELIEASLEEKRAILTKDRELLKNNRIMHGYWIRNNSIEKQVKEVIERFDLKDNITEFMRCLECNSILIPVEKDKIADKLPSKVREWQENFWYCEQCDKIYWKGTHYEKMIKFIEQIRDEL
ncbi:MAG TPA: Mut7-C RNAse domain-containing protein [Ignavibacteriaceae bacterium]|nr:Mut7-C RNAse domain-containing protein [Ignavibacteriaceae bacterium]